MTDIPFTYGNYENARAQLIAFINSMLNKEDKALLVGFEEGNPQWERSAYSDLKDFPSIQWKLFNVNKLKTQNQAKHRQEVERLKSYLGIRL